ncbi:MAG: hypothetical protein V1746_06030 [bacterium]
MIFRHASPQKFYQTLRLVSEKKIWNLGMEWYPSGMRFRMGRVARPPRVMDFCMGTNASLYAPVLAAALNRLESIPESATCEEIDACFPWAGTRPNLNVHLDCLLERINTP